MQDGSGREQQRGGDDGHQRRRDGVEALVRQQVDVVGLGAGAAALRVGAEERQRDGARDGAQRVLDEDVEPAALVVVRQRDQVVAVVDPLGLARRLRASVVQHIVQAGLVARGRLLQLAELIDAEG